MADPDRGSALPARRHPAVHQVASSLARPAIFGAFDGTASLLGVVVYLLFTHPVLIFPTALSGAASSAVSMGGGEWLSDSDSGFTASSVMAAATFAGGLLPAIPFAFGTGALTVAESAVICGCIGICVSAMRPERTFRRALTETSALLAVIFTVVLLCALYLPGGGG